MESSLFTQIMTAPLPVKFYGGHVVEELKILVDAGYIKVAFASQGAETPCAMVNEVTVLGRAVARYFGTDYGPRVGRH